MPASDAAAASRSRLKRLLGYLEQDPVNLPLLADASNVAYEDGELEAASQLIERYAAQAPLPVAMRNLQGMIAIQANRFEEALALFGALRLEKPADPAVNFNLAWCAAMLKDYQTASTLLDQDAIEVSPRGPALKIQMLHRLGQLDKALAWGPGLLERHPADHALAGALATVAMDAENLPLADYYAKRAGDQHNGLTAAGFLQLNGNNLENAEALFDRALASAPKDPRALLGKGLANLSRSEPLKAAELIDEAARLFETHLGTWVAAGWTYLIAGDEAASRDRFMKAASIDDTFAETHGALAVLDLLQADVQPARQRIAIALRLDRKCFAAALAQSMLLTRQGDLVSAQKIRDIALKTPIGQDGLTLAQAIVGLSLGSRTLH